MTTPISHPRPGSPVDLGELGDELGRHPATAWAVADLERAIAETGSSLRVRVAGPVDELGEEGYRIEAGDPVSVTAGDVRGLVYALAELAEVTADGGDPSSTAGRWAPATPVRGVMRLLSSEIEDERWFRDRDFWERYLGELARDRVNRFTLTMGIGYDYLVDKDYRDLYFQFPYPFWVAPEGWDVRAEGISAEDRAANLDLLRFIGRTAQARGIAFRLGIWNNAYDCGPFDGGPARFAVSGLDGSTHAAYVRDALVALLEACPEIEGLTLRVHYEGGIPEPTHEFWQVALSRLAEVDTLREIDVHAKGIDDRLMAVFHGTGKRFAVATKFWAEHTGPAYHQASIRRREFAPIEPPRAGTATTSHRNATRYSYADFLRTQRDYDVIFRIWPGSQRLLLWGDPASAAMLARAGTFGGSQGWDWFEPLSLKGKKGSGHKDGRDLYRREDLRLGVDDWRKYRYTLRLFGRLGYDPDAAPETWRRVLRAEYGAEAERVERALAPASRIIPLIVAAHAPAAAQNLYWPEIYTDVPLVTDPVPAPDPLAKFGWPKDSSGDMDGPYLFHHVSPLDPVVYYAIHEYAQDREDGAVDGRITPLEVADELTRLAEAALAAAGERPDLEQATPQVVRALVDAVISARTGLFFASKIRAGYALSIAEIAGRPEATPSAVRHYEAAIAQWDLLCEVADVYADDQSFGQAAYSRGHWRDRRPAMAADLERLRARADGLPASAVDAAAVHEPTDAAPLVVEHDPAADVEIGADTARIRVRTGPDVRSVLLYQRPVDQSAAWTAQPMDAFRGSTWRTEVAAGDSAYPTQYFFEVIGSGTATRWPRYDPERGSTPYFVVGA
jgi:hypothetical protein